MNYSFFLPYVILHLQPLDFCAAVEVSPGWAKPISETNAFLIHTVLTTLDASPPSLYAGALTILEFNAPVCSVQQKSYLLLETQSMLLILQSKLTCLLSDHILGSLKPAWTIFALHSALSMYTPCNESAWCAPVSRTNLTTALDRACECDGPICITWFIPTIRNYYQGSSSTGLVGSAMLTCQDVAVGKRWHLHWHPSCVGSHV